MIRRGLTTLERIAAPLWLGAMIGVSAIATPAKFRAQSLSLPTALEVGRETFAMFHPLEWGLCAALCLCAARNGGGWRRLGAALLAALTLAQALWLTPALDLRVAAVIAGTPAPPSLHHVAYVAIEGLKLLSLGVWAAALAVKAPQRPIGRSR